MTAAYLTSQYPAVSHTFIRREIEAVRAAGVPVRTYSVRPGTVAPGDARQQAAADETFVVLAQPAIRYIASHAVALAASPARYFGTLRLALKHRVPGLRALVWALFHFAEAIVLARRLKHDGVRRVHNHFANPAATVGMLAAHYLRLPWSLTLHGISEFDYPAGVLLPAKLERAEFAACVSYFGMAQAMRITPPAIWPRLALVRCGIDPADLPEAPRKRDGSAPCEAICVGRLSPEKGHAGLLATIAALAGKEVPVRLTLVGDGPEEERLRAQVGALGLEGHVTFTGRLDERAALEAIAAADMLILPSFMEGLPIVLMEAMALGVPVIASRVAGIPELVEDGHSGLLFDPGHWAQLETAIERLCGDAPLRGALAEEGRQRVAREFTYPGAANAIAALLRENGSE